MLKPRVSNAVGLGALKFMAQELRHHPFRRENFLEAIERWPEMPKDQREKALCARLEVFLAIYPDKVIADPIWRVVTVEFAQEFLRDETRPSPVHEAFR